MSPFLPTPLENVQGGNYCVLLLCSASTKDETQVYVSQRRDFQKNMTVSDKTADYCSKNIFQDEASLLENNNQDNGRLSCCVTPLKWFKKGKKRRSHALDVTVLRLGSVQPLCPLAADSARRGEEHRDVLSRRDSSMTLLCGGSTHSTLHLKTIMRTLPPLGCKVFPYRSTNSTVKIEHQGSSY